MSSNSKRARNLLAPTGAKADYKVLAPYTGTGSHSDALFSMADVVKEGAADPSVQAVFAAMNLRDLKNLNVVDGGNLPASYNYFSF